MSRSRRIAIGLDVGTSSVKATAVTDEGDIVGVTSTPYPTAIPFDGAAEQNPDHWWAAVGEVLDGIAAKLPDLEADRTVIGLTGQMHTSVLLGEYDEVLRPAILWSDKRSARECAELVQAVPDYAAITGNPPMTAFTVAHLMWVRRHEPEVAGRVRAVLNPKDEIRRRLGAGSFTEPSDASATGLFDTRTGEWSGTVGSPAGVDVKVLPAIAASHDATGVVRSLPGGIAAENSALGRLRGARVFGGAGDQAAQAIALGVTSPGTLGLSLGTSGVAFGSVSEPQNGAFRHAYPDTWLALDSMHAAGLSVAWLARLLGVPVPELSADVAPEECPLFLPYLQGHRGGSGAPGSFVGLDAHHLAPHLAYAVMEGVAFELARLGEGIGALDPAMPVRLGGGGGRNPLWRKIIASAFGRNVFYNDRDSSFGAAVVAAEGDGWWTGSASDDTASGVVTDPDPSMVVAMVDRRQRFESISRALANVK